jgi:hypothetical protein
MKHLLALAFILTPLYAHAWKDGICLSGNCQNGTGTMKSPADSIYEGTWKDGKKHGRGVCLPIR